jgi:hypothetical protein
MGQRRQWLALALCMAAWLPVAADTSYLSVKRKLDQIESGRLRPGMQVELSLSELNAYAEHEAPAGVRNPRLRLVSPDEATGTALVDFVKLRSAQGADPGWLLATLLEGEHPVRVTARIRSGKGQAIVDVEKVEISGMTIEGSALDFLIRNVLLPLYPSAAVGRPFELGHHIDRIAIRPDSVAVLIGK